MAASAPAASPYQVAAAPVPGNRRRARALLLGAGVPPAVVVLVVLLVIVGPIPGLVVGVVLWAAIALFITRSATALALRALPAVPAQPERHARLHNLTESLCVASGLPKPRLMVVDDPRPNSLSLGMHASSTTVVVTSALADEFTRLEMEAVLAHELSHVRRGDTALGTAAAAVLRPLLGVAPRLCSQMVERLVGEAEACADVAAVGLTRYPPALLSALRRMSESAPAAERRRGTVDLLWNAPLGPEASAVLEARMEALLEL